MSDVVILQRFRVKRDTAAAFAAANTLLLEGEFGLETDTRKLKIGDGVTAWNALGYLDASFWQYDNAISGLAATDVQEALDELANYSVADLSDVDAVAPNDGDVLIFDAVSGTWKPGAQSGGGGGSSLAGSATVSGAAASSITVSGLDLSAAGGYRVVVGLKNALGSSINILLYYNGDTTPGNYDRLLMTASSSGAPVIRSDDAAIGSISAGSSADGHIDILPSLDGVPSAAARITRDRSTALAMHLGSHVWTSATNVTSITIQSSVANGFAVGSYMKVFRQ